MVIVFFIMVCTAATLFVAGHHDIADAAAAAEALRPMAGKWATLLFAFGLLNASLFAASILPLSTAHVICEGLGFEAGIDHKFRDAPIFYWLYTILIVVGGGLILIPGAPLFKILLFSQVANGVWLPIVLIFIVLLSSRRDLMGDFANSKTFAAIAWITSVLVIILTMVLIFAAIFPSKLGGVPGL
jgi:Mn2+/Fe2+ NRAMP family transporter